MNITTTFRNETAKQLVRVVTDRSGIWFEGAEVVSVSDNEMGRTRIQTETLLNYWRSAGHKITEK